MNPITLFILAAVFIGLLGPVLVILEAVSKIQTSRAKDSDRARIAKHRQDEADRRASLHEAKIARENNNVVLIEMKIEKARLELIALEKQINPPEFEVKDYQSS